jgi:hypothetical protein
MKRLLVITLAGFCAVAVVRGEEPAAPEQQLNETWDKLSVVEKRRLLHLQRALQQMPPEERRFIHERIEHFLTMTPAERDRLRQNRERWEKMSPEDRDRARQEFRQRRKEFEEQWRREHPDSEPPPLHLHRSQSSPPAAAPETSEPKPKQENP